MLTVAACYTIGFLSLQFFASFHGGLGSSLGESGSVVPDSAGSNPEITQENVIETMQRSLDIVLKTADNLQAELSKQQEQLAAIKEETKKNEYELEKRLNSVADENLQLVQLLQRIASVVDNEQENITKLEPKTVEMLSENPKIELTMTATGGVSYVRWGRTTCQGSATLLYRGFAASGGSASSGGTSDVVCLHSVPEVRNTVAGGSLYSPLVMVEYEFNNLPFQKSNNGGKDLLNHDMPCAVCHVSTRTNQLMIPGRYTCPSGWVSEYWGYLVSTRYNSFKGKLVCLDEIPEATSGGSLNDAAAQGAYPVEIKCGGTHCPPYHADNELTCVVCSK